MRKTPFAAGLLLFAAGAFGQAAKSRPSLPDFDIRAGYRGEAGDIPSAAFRLPASARAAAAAPSINPALVNPRLAGRLAFAAGFETGRGRVFHFRQEIEGIPVYEGRVDVLAGDTAIRAVSSGLVAGASIDPRPRLTIAEAARAAERSLGMEDSREPAFADLAILAVRPGHARLAWRMISGSGASWYEVLIDAHSGELLTRHSLARRAGRGRVWLRSPLDPDRETVNFPDAWLAAAQTTTNGNNVDAYLDANADDRPDSITDTGIRDGRASSATQEFDFPSIEGSRSGDPRLGRAASLTNLFYFVNRAHDYFYRLGFDEASWNLQKDNFGRGAAGGDALLAEAQDPEVLDNAVLIPAPDGLPPRLQTGIFTLDTLGRGDDRDSALDGDVVTHEYTHAVTHRIIGRGADIACLNAYQSSALSEGWSDYFAASSYNSPVVGAYVTNNPAQGFRRSRFDANTTTYSGLGASVGGYEEHDDGEFWTAALWDLRAALGAPIADKLIFEALRITPCRPSMVDARDAIVATDAAINGGRNLRAIWTVFAKRGLGASACGHDGNRALPVSGWSGTVHAEAFDLPADLETQSRPKVGIQCGDRGPGVANFGVTFEHRITVDRPGAAFAVKAGPAGTTVDADGIVRFTPGFEQQRVQVEVSRAGAGPVLYTMLVPVATRLQPGVPMGVFGRQQSASFFYFDVPAGTTVAQVRLRGGGGDGDLILIDPTGRLAGTSLHDTNDETIAVSKPQAGSWTLIVPTYYWGFAQAQLSVSLAEPAYIAPGRGVSNLTEVRGGELYFRTVVPPGTQSLAVRTSLGSGDADVFLRRGQAMVCKSVYTLFLDDIFDCTPRDSAGTGPGTDHTANVENPFPGDWYIAVQGADAFSGVSLNVQLTARQPALIASHASLSFTVREGGAPPEARTVTISESGGKPFEWRATVQPATAKWLSATPAAGNNIADLRVNVDPAGLAAGRYEAKLLVDGAGLAGSPFEIPVVLTITAPARVTASPTSLTFQGSPAANPDDQVVRIGAGDTALAWTARVFTSDGGRWLSVTPASGAGSADLRVILNSSLLPPGRYQGTVTVSAAGAQPAEIPVLLEQGRPVAIAGITDAARGAALTRLAPGTRLIIAGSELSSATIDAEGPPYPDRLGGVEVRFNGQLGEIVRVAPDRIDVAAPFDLTGLDVAITVVNAGRESSAIRVPLAEQTPGIFALLGNGAGAGWILGEDGAVISRDRPLIAGEAVTIHMSGLGRVAGDGAVLTPLPVFFDGIEAAVSGEWYSGRLRGGVYEIFAVVPPGLARKYPEVRIGESNIVTAGGPSLAAVTPSRLTAGQDATLTIAGLNLPASANVRVGDAVIAAAADEAGRSIVVTVPGSVLAPGDALVSVSAAAAPDEPASNALRVTIGAP
ncbi:MAG: M36 family metallopeptidase [Bryobacteraceae bacterium]